MKDKFRKIIIYAKDNGWEGPKFPESATFCELIREPEHGLLKAIYGEDTPIPDELPNLKEIMGSNKIRCSIKRWELKAEEFATMLLPDVVDEIHNYITK
jgi:hypothetical protein|tara:strand:- start:594 stop:890 length:297 start_codon:yes stop_codon:yes gene_type:complete